MQRPAFTLIELMLVIVIIGVVYGLLISNMKRYSENSYDLSLVNLPEFLHKNYEKENVSFICTQLCESCGVYKDGQRIQEVDSFLDASLKAYRFDHRYGTSEMAWPSLFGENGNEEEVCFRYDHTKDSSTEPMLVSFANKVTAYLGMFAGTVRYDSIDEAVKAQEALLYQASR